MGESDMPRGNAEQFQVMDGVLLQYTGPGGEVRVPEGVTRILEAAFDGYESKITTLVFPSSLRALDCAFAGWKALQEISFENGITDLPHSVCRECVSLESVRLPASLFSVSIGAFYNCASLRHMEIPSGVRALEKHAFCNCSSLEDISLDEALEEIGEDAFFRLCRPEGDFVPCRSQKDSFAGVSELYVSAGCFSA